MIPHVLWEAVKPGRDSSLSHSPAPPARAGAGPKTRQPARQPVSDPVSPPRFFRPIRCLFIFVATFKFLVEVDLLAS